MKTEPHVLNKGYNWSDIKGPFRLLNKQQADQFNEEGYCILDNVISPDVLKRLRDITDEADDDMEARLAKTRTDRVIISHAGKITVFPHMVSRSKVVDQFVRGNMFKDICHDFMGTDAQLYNDQIVYKKSGMQEHFPWHQDNGYAYIEPEQYITCWIPLVNATAENGCPWVLPGFHKKGTLAHRWAEYGYVCVDEEIPQEAVCCPVKAGDVLVFSSLTPHMTGPNKTAQTRKAYIVQFCTQNAKRVLYNKKTGKRYFSLKIFPPIEYFIVKQVLRPSISKALMALKNYLSWKKNEVT